MHQPPPAPAETSAPTTPAQRAGAVTASSRRRFRRRFHLKLERRHVLWSAAAVSTGVYLALFVSLAPALGPAGTLLAALPVGVIGGIWGALAGAAVGIGAIPITALILAGSGHGGWAALVQTEAGAASLAVVLIGLTLGAVRDRVRPRRARDQLTTDEFRIIFEFAPVGAAYLDLEGRVVAANRALQAMLGLDDGRLSGRSLLAFTHPDDAALSGELHRQLTGGERDCYELEQRVNRADGSIGWARVTACTVHGPGDGHRFILAIIDDITGERAHQAALEYQALHDHLTELPNRVLLIDRLEQAIRESRRRSNPLALLILDLDGFKDVNDTLGHHSGDVLLKEAAARIHGQVRESDTVARLGGDEFAIMLPMGGDVTIATIVADKILQALGPPLVLDGHVLSVGASIGIAICPDHAEDATALLRHADVAMYAAKRTGSGFAVYDESHDRHRPLVLTLAADLRKAIEANELSITYAPAVDVETGVVSGAQAQLGWRRPDQRALGFEDPLSAAETARFVAPLMEWFIHTALAEVRQWRAGGLQAAISFRLPATAVQDPHFLGAMERELQTSRFAAGELKLELPEAMLRHDPESVLARIVRLRALGIEVAVEGFGSGVASLLYLRRRAVHEIKLAPELVREAARVEQTRTVVRSITRLAHDLDIRVVADGVDSREVWDVLPKLGCDAAQGDFVSAPLSAPELWTWAVTREPTDAGHQSAVPAALRRPSGLRT